MSDQGLRVLVFKFFGHLFSHKDGAVLSAGTADAYSDVATATGYDTWQPFI